MNPRVLHRYSIEVFSVQEGARSDRNPTEVGIYLYSAGIF